MDGPVGAGDAQAVPPVQGAVPRVGIADDDGRTTRRHSACTRLTRVGVQALRSPPVDDVEPPLAGVRESADITGP